MAVIAARKALSSFAIAGAELEAGCASPRTLRAPGPVLDCLDLAGEDGGIDALQAFESGVGLRVRDYARRAVVGLRVQ